MAFVFTTNVNGELVITGIVDPDVDFNARGIELYISGTEDLSDYTFQRSANGGSFGSDRTLSGSFTNQFVYVVFDTTAFNTVFGISGSNVISTNTVTGTGNDAFRFINTATSSVVDVVGDAGGSNIYNDSFMYRNNNTGPDGAWAPTNWNIPGNGELDGLDAAATSAAVPFGSFSAVPEPTSFLMFGTLVMGGLGFRRRKS